MTKKPRKLPHVNLPSMGTPIILPYSSFIEVYRILFDTIKITRKLRENKGEV